MLISSNLLGKIEKNSETIPRHVLCLYVLARHTHILHDRVTHVLFLRVSEGWPRVSQRLPSHLERRLSDVMAQTSSRPGGGCVFLVPD
jgi:hypothetical protein